MLEVNEVIKDLPTEYQIQIYEKMQTMSEEEQEARFKARRQAEKKRLKEIFDKAFSSWKESKWKSFERAYIGFVG